MVAAFVLVYCLVLCWRRHTRGALRIQPRARAPYSVSYHADNPIYDDVYQTTTTSTVRNGDGQESTGRETVAILPLVPVSNAHDYGAAGPSAVQTMTTWEPNGNEDITTEEMQDLHTLQQWDRMHNKVHKKEEWMEMTVFK